MKNQRKVKQLAHPIAQNSVLMLNIDEVYSVPKIIFIGQTDFIGGAVNSTKEAATKINAHISKYMPRVNDPVMFLINHVKKMELDRCITTIKNTIELATISGFYIPDLCTDNGAIDMKV